MRWERTVSPRDKQNAIRKRDNLRLIETSTPNLQYTVPEVQDFESRP